MRWLLGSGTGTLFAALVAATAASTLDDSPAAVHVAAAVVGLLMVWRVRLQPGDRRNLWTVPAVAVAAPLSWHVVTRGITVGTLQLVVAGVVLVAGVVVGSRLSPRSAVAFRAAFLLLTVSVALIGVSEAVTGIRLLHGSAYYDRMVTEQRYASIIGHPLVYGTLVAAAAAWALDLSLRFRRGWLKWGAAGLVLLAGIGVSGSRSSVILVGLAVTLSAVRHRSWRSPTRATLTMLVAVAVLLGVALSGVLGESIGARFAVIDSQVYRAAGWHVVPEHMTLESAILGHGPLWVYRTDVLPGGFGALDNQALTFVAELGLPAAVVLILAAFRSWRRLYGRRSDVAAPLFVLLGASFAFDSISWYAVAFLVGYCCGRGWTATPNRPSDTDGGSAVCWLDPVSTPLI